MSDAAWLAAAAVLANAISLPSFAGLVFLALFLIWCTFPVLRDGQEHTRKVQGGFWAVVALASGAFCVAQCVLQALYQLRPQQWEPGGPVMHKLELLGFPLCATLNSKLQVLVPEACCVLLSAALASYLFRARPGRRRQPRDPLSIINVKSGLLTFLTVVAVPYPNSFFFVVVALIAVLASWSTLLAAPAMLALLLQLYSWARGRPGPLAIRGGIVALQLATGAHIVVVYLAQITGLQLARHTALVDYLNVPILASAADAETLSLQLVHVAAAHVLFLALACYASALDPAVCQQVSVQDIVDRVHDEVLQGDAEERRRWNSLQTQLEAMKHFLPSSPPAVSDPDRPLDDVEVLRGGAHHRRTAAHASTAAPAARSAKRFGVAEVVLPVLQGTLAHWVQVFAASPVFVALLLCCFSLVAPSVTAGFMLLLGLWTLMAPKGVGGRQLVACSHLLLSATLAWWAACYVTMALCHVLVIPDTARFIGLSVPVACDGAANAYLMFAFAVFTCTLASLTRSASADREVLWHIVRRELLVTAQDLCLYEAPAGAAARGAASPSPGVRFEFPRFAGVDRGGATAAARWRRLNGSRTLSRRLWDELRAHSASLQASPVPAAEHGGSSFDGDPRSSRHFAAGAEADGARPPPTPSREDSQSCSPLLEQPDRSELPTPRLAHDHAPGDRATAPAAHPTRFLGEMLTTILGLDYVMFLLRALKTSGVHAICYLGFAGVPVGWFVVGVWNFNLLTAVYLALLLLGLLRVTLPLVPGPGMAAVSFPQHTSMRVLAALHLCALYVARMTQRWLFAGDVAAQPWLELLGLWDVHVMQDMLPVMLAFLLATVHASLCEWLQQQLREHHHEPPGRQSTSEWSNAGAAAGPSPPQDAAGDAAHAGSAWGVPASHAGSQALGGGRASREALRSVESEPSTRESGDQGLLSLAWSEVASPEGVALHSPVVYYLGRLALATGAQMVALLAYALIIWDAPFGLLGLSYLVLSVGIAVFPPRKPMSQLLAAAASGARSSEDEYETARASPWRWGLLSALAFLCALDQVAQYLLSATPLVHPSSSLCKVMYDVIGVACGASYGHTAHQLARPFLLLSAMQLYRFSYAVGRYAPRNVGYTRPAPPPSRADAQEAALEQQCSWTAFLRRVLIRHANKAVLCMCFAVAAIQPCVLGLGLVVGAAWAALVLGGPSGPRKLVLASLTMAALVMTVVAWVLLQYAMCIDWLRLHLLGPDTEASRSLLKWIGIPILQDVGSGDPRASLEAALHWKVLLLVAVVLQGRAWRWLTCLPSPLTDGAPRGALCLLFWPPPGMVVVTSSGALLPGQRGQARGLMGRMMRLLEAIVASMQTQAVTFVDLFGHGREEAAAGDGKANIRAQRVDDAPASNTSKFRLGAAALLVAAQVSVESIWALCGIDVCLLALLIAALVSSNVLSLVYVVFLGLGMWLRERRLATAFSVIAPILAVAAVLQYALLIEPPKLGPVAANLLPTASSGLVQLATRLLGATDSGASLSTADGAQLSAPAGSLDGGGLPPHRIQSAAQDWSTWLGLEPTLLSVAFTFIAFLLGAMQANHLAWAHAPPPAPTAASARAASPGASADAEPGLAEPLLGAEPQQSAFLEGAHARSGPSQPELASADPSQAYLDTTRHAVCQLADGEVVLDIDAGSESLSIRLVSKLPRPVWAPVTAAAQPTWLWHDWLRFLILRHILDAFMIVILLLCCVNRDVIHAGYLALALYFFRKREGLREHGRREFFWLPLLNWLVILLSLAYQAPLTLFADDERGNSDCSLARVIGLFHFDNTDAFSLSYRGAAAHLLMWLAIQAQSTLLETTAFKDTVRLLRVRQDEARQLLLQRRRAALATEAQQCLEASRLRAARARRISRLKSSIQQSGGQLGADPAGLLDASLLPAASSASQNVNPLDAAAGEPPRHACAPSPGPAAAAQASAGGLAVRLPSPPDPATPTGSHARAARMSMLRSAWSRLLQFSREQIRNHAAHVHVAYMLAFVSDFSLLSLVFPASGLLYALLTDPSSVYWRLVLVYSEALLVAQYIYQIALQQGCIDSFAQPRLNPLLQRIGLHADLVRCMPLFLVYFVTLMHSYFLGLVDPALRPAADAPSRASSASTAPHGGSLDEPPRRWPRSAVARLRRELTAASQAFGRFCLGARLLARRCCRRTSADPNFVLLTLEASEQDVSRLLSSEAAKRGLSRSLQAAFDDLTTHDQALRAAERASSPDAEIWRALGDGDPSLACVLRSRSSALGLLPTASSRHLMDLARIAPLLVDVFDVLPTSSSSEVQVLVQVRSTPQRAQHDWQLLAGMLTWAAWPPASLQPGADAALAIQRLSLLQAAAREHAAEAGHSSSVPVSGSSNADGVAECSLAGDVARSWPLRASADEDYLPLAPADVLRDVGSTSRSESRNGTQVVNVVVERSEQDVSGSLVLGDAQRSSPGGGDGGGGPESAFDADLLAVHGLKDISIKQVESHTKAVQDWYAFQLLFAALSFAYFAVFCQSLVSSVESISDEVHAVPTTYLVVLIIIFLDIVVDRVCYSRGSDFGKAVLHLVEVVVIMYFATTVFWTRAVILPTANFHIRVFMLLRLPALALSALQIKSSYPSATVLAPGRSTDLLGGGRQDFYFYRHVDVVHFLLFQGFRAVPFVYELKAVLDWSCTASSLNLYDWLKLEDIRASLYNRQCDLHQRSKHIPGQKQPPMDKLLQGSLLFVALLLLLWVPLLVFSTNNPTFQIPELNEFTFNISLAATASTDGVHSTMRTLLYSAGMEHSKQEWLRPDRALPRSLVTLGYEPAQLQLQCTSPDSDRFWSLPPPLHAHWVDAIDHAIASAQSVGVNGARDGAPGYRIAVELAWSTMRSFPPESAYGGPQCRGTTEVPLAVESLRALSAALRGEADWAPLLARRHPHGDGGEDATAGRGLYALVWRLKGHKCVSSAMYATALDGSEGWSERDWAAYQVGCDVGLRRSSGGDLDPRSWWKLRCAFLDSNGTALPHAGGAAPEALAGGDVAAGSRGNDTDVFTMSCPAPPSEGGGGAASDEEWRTGPGLVAVVERVQSGLLGETLSSYGITGLYGLLVFGVARFLRLSVANMRLRIQYEDLPNVAQLCVLCNDISIARAEGELLLEEQLYHCLINVYRLPSVLFELTKKDKAL